MGFKFEKLGVWQSSLDFATKVSKVCANFPKDGLYILTAQFKRATDSICLNIAEGSTGQTNPEFSKFLGYAIPSGIECVSCVHLAKRRSLINDAQLYELYEELEAMIRQLQALRKTLN